MRIRLFLLAVLLPFAFSLLVQASAPVYAASLTGTWIDYGRISFNGSTFTDIQPFDGTHEYKQSQHNCVDKIGADPTNSPGSGTYVNLQLSATGQCYVVSTDGSTHQADPSNGNVFDNPDYSCPGCRQKITLGSTDRSTIGIYHVADSAGAVDTTQVLAYVTFGDTQTLVAYKKLPSGDPAAASHPNRYYLVGTDGKLNTQVYIDLGSSNTADIHNSLASILGGPGDVTVKVAPNPLSATDAQQILGAAGGGSNTPTAVADSCESQSEALGWIMCPVIKLLDEAATWLDGQVQQLLTTPDPTSLGGAGGNGLEQGWSRVRNITLILVIPVMLVMIISTALGFSFVDAYTIKRAMPRLLIAIIAISLSFYLMSFLVEVTNSIGQGLLGLLTTPFWGSTNVSLATLIPASTSAALTVTGLGVFAALVASGVVSFMIILSFAFVTVIALLVGFVILTLRQLLILALIVVAPIAILLWVFPGTERGWKLWWTNYSKLLLMFPLIMLMIAMGRDFAWIIAHSSAYSGVDDLLARLMVIIAYIAPFFFIPAAFKMGGTMFGALAGFATGATAGLRQGQTKFRGSQRAQNLQDFKSGKRFEGKSYIPGSRRLAKRVNSVSVGLGTGFKGGFGLGEKGKQAIDQSRRASMDEIMKSGEWGGVNQNDDALHAATYDNAGAALADLTTKWGDAERAKRAVKSVQASIGFGRPQAIAAAQQLVTIGTGYKDYSYTDAAGVTHEVSAMEDMVATLGRASGGNSSTASALAGFSNSQAKAAGRHDLAPSFGTLDTLVQGAAGTRNAKMAPGTAAWAAEMDKAKTNAWNSASLYAHANDKPDNLKSHIAHHTKMLNDGIASGDAAKIETAATFFKELNAMKPNAIGENSKLINAALASTQAQVDQGMGMLAATPLSPETSRTVTDPSTLVQDPTTGEFRRPVIASRAETAAERVDRNARTYEREDPNRTT